jgi:phosphatidyl-myo-inositol dimannoside synthase
VCKVAGKALQEYALEKEASVKVLSMHDANETAIGNPYFSSDIFRGYGAAKATFILDAVKIGKKCDIVILSHINLLVVAWLIKKRNPNTTIILLAHGIEIWGELSPQKQKMLGVCDKVVSVSTFTKDTIIAQHKIDTNKCFVLNNCIDPFLVRPKVKNKDEQLMKRYQLNKDDIVLLTLSRLSSKDRYKGYDFIIDAMVNIVKKYKNVRHILAGGADKEEKIFLENKIAENGLDGHVILAGYLPEEELANHFSLADVYIMPSIKEGFGIVFVEAMYYRLPVIAGNVDGSTDALLNGKLGLLINPEDTNVIYDGIEQMILNRKAYIPDDKLLLNNFGYEAYKNNLKKILLQ